MPSRAEQYEELVAMCEMHVWDWHRARDVGFREECRAKEALIRECVREIGTMEATLIYSAFQQRGRR